ncbi:flagellar filament capping protein FliD [Desulfoscipio gibsoniae]
MASGLRIAGLASGIDTESIIKDLMNAQRIPLQKLQQERQILEWKQENYREINTSLRTFRDVAFNMKLQGTYIAKNTHSSNEDAVAAECSSSTPTGSYTVKVNNLATGVSKGSKTELADEKNEDGTTKTLAEQFGVSGDEDGKINFTLEGAKGQSDFSFDKDTDSIYDVVIAINDADLGIRASYDATLNRFFLNTESTGSAQKIVVTNDENNFLSYGESQSVGDSILKLDIQEGSADYKGVDASFDFGDVTGLTSSTNTVTVNGITLELKEGGGATGTITVSNDTEAVFDAVIDFIDKYNSLMETISNKLYEKSYKDYTPLTDEQREKLTDDQIDTWTDKARSGLLRYDSMLSELYNKFRTTMSSVVNDVSGGYMENGKLVKNDRLSKLGITTTKDYMSAKLEINDSVKDQLRKAIQNDPQGIIDLFTKSSDAEDASDSELGIAQRLYNNVNYGINRLMEKAGSESDFALVDESVIGEEIGDIDDDIETMEDRLQQVEDRYWRQFTAMEQAIQQLNSQSAWLAQQFGMNG